MSFLSWTARRAVANAEKRGASLRGRVAVITGASSGIGEETARVLAAAGMTVVLAVRNVAKGEQAVASFGDVSPGKCVVMRLDLASLASVRQFAADFLATGLALHVLVFNGGMFADSLTLTEDGYETTFQVHVVAHYYLLKLLEAKLVASGPDARVVFVSSVGHAGGRIHFPDKPGAKGFLQDSTTWSVARGMQAYAQAKLAQLVIARFVAKSFADRGVSVFGVHPGGVNTNVWPWYVKPIAAVIMINVGQGAGTQVHVGVSPALRGHGFEYWTPALVGAPHRAWYSRRAAVDSDEVGARLVGCVEQMIVDRVGTEGWVPLVVGRA